MADVTIKHVFVSAKADGADATRVKPSDWNAAFAWTGGVAGDVPAFDTGSATDATWVRRARALTTNTTAVGNVGAGADTLMSYSLPASTLLVDGQALRITVHGTMAGNANAKAITLDFGSTSVALITTTAAPNGKDWRAEATVIRVGVGTQEMFTIASGGTVFEQALRSAPAETLTSAVTIKCTATAVADNDVVQRSLIVELLN